MKKKQSYMQNIDKTTISLLKNFEQIIIDRGRFLRDVDIINRDLEEEYRHE